MTLTQSVRKQMSADSEYGTPVSVVTAMQAVLEWSKDRPAWQQDAIRRLIDSPELTDADTSSLEQICLGDMADCIPLSEQHIAAEDASNEPISLVKLFEPKGINALANDQELNIAPVGVSIIYGDNGSGKSGFVRVLKHACRSRDSKIDILPDINEPENTEQSASIDILRGSSASTVNWNPTYQSFDLSKVSIFDSRSANTHVQAENNVAYIPVPMRILQTLSETCDVLKSRIEAKIGDVESRTPAVISDHSLSPNSAAGSYITSLSAKSDIPTLDLLVALNEDEVRRTATLESDLSQDPKIITAKLKAQQTRLNGFVEKIKSAIGVSSEGSIAEFANFKSAYESAKMASKVASEELFAASPLPEIGNEAWKLLWDAARNYSDHVAYKEKVFPEAEAHSDLCVLCQQPLGEEAVARRATFEEFVKGSATSKEASSKQIFDAKQTTLKNAIENMSYVDELIPFIRDELESPELSDQLLAVFEQSYRRIECALKGREIPPIEKVMPVEMVEALTGELQKRVDQLSADENSPERKQLVDELRALKDRQKLAGIKDDVIAEIARKNEIVGLKKALKDTSKRPVTNKNKELSDQLVTNTLRARFAREIDKLKLGITPLELKKVRDRNAQSFFQVEFIGHPGRPVGEVLSEGEHRCVALAAFLAELVTSEEKSGIVFDDPMSSLDHIYRQNVAKRLVEEAGHRQVVIFTHDLSFMFEVIREAEAQAVSLHYQNVKRRAGKPGYVANELPMKAKNAPAMVNALQSELKDFKGQYDTVPDARRVIFAKGVIEQLRETWDQVIADFISPVLGRFDNKIKGTSLYKLLDLKMDDVTLITAARSRLSEDLHVAAEALNPENVSHQELSDETKIIHDFIEDLKNRPKTAQPRITVL